MQQKHYFELTDLEAYRLSREYSKLAWETYMGLSWQYKKIIGDQMITSVDSVGANIAEGYGRFHFLDKNKFYYNARASLLESGHWLALMSGRGMITKEKFEEMKSLREKINLKINSLIKSQYNQNK